MPLVIPLSLILAAGIGIWLIFRATKERRATELQYAHAGLTRACMSQAWKGSLTSAVGVNAYMRNVAANRRACLLASQPGLRAYEAQAAKIAANRRRALQTPHPAVLEVAE